jgi:hypothetical protein
VIVLPVLFFDGAARLRTEVRRDRPDRPLIGLLAFILLNLVYVTVLTNAVELGENNRFRFTIEPLVAVLAASSAERVAAWLRGWRAPRRIDLAPRPTFPA